MSVDTKRNILGATCLICVVFMTICIWRMIPSGLAGESSKVRLDFILMIFAFVFSLASGLAYYYYRSQRNDDHNLERIRTEVNALSQVGQKSVLPKRKSSQQSQLDDPQSDK
jgi:hypothetical protein